MSQTEKVLREALEVLEAYASSQICTHDDTHRGGTLWEICDQCGAKWADDKGGKPRFKWPKEILAARAALSLPETQGEPVAWVECDGELVWQNKAAAIGRNLYTRPSVPAGMKLVPVEPTEAVLRPFYECPPDELRLAWAAMLRIAETYRGRAMLAAAPAAPEAK